MSTTEASDTATHSPELFAVEAYDLEGTPKLNGRKASSVVLSFESFELDHTDAEHMALVGKLMQGRPVAVRLELHAGKRTWAERTDDDGVDNVGYTLRVAVKDIAE